ncbi:QVPTGV class sortase B protein-sorting domain-containing protein [Subdoligranulum sp. DSM 109015]|uniref:QVPTGV class sortase B protein-sorting domain-containing protein n=1 Tax=Gemmiger gallinarum TaxID=2779354 RepID=A0ABR9R5Z1_9FIRM|nr:QVPTGV class sortase B protein-sorting domain-containing protein [Gemmiger gallinarum]MBE5038557.1 QVPTGV class sortase B protein-sorting domain-containing protein [Gemmiger gallinarum]
MKLNKTIGRVATTLVATAMLASLAAPAYAAEMDDDGVVATSDTSITLTQTIDVSGAEDANNPHVIFTYKIDGNSNTTGANASLPVHTGTKPTDVDGDWTVQAVFDGTETKTNNLVSDTFDIDFTHVQWDGVGVYRYKLTQSNNNGAVALDTNPTRYLDVYVGNDDTTDDYKVLYYVLTTDGTLVFDSSDAGDTYNHGTKSAGFTADYNTYTLTVKKYVTGDMGSKNDSFDFTVNFENLPAGVEVSVDSDAAVSSNVVTKALQDGQTITIKGIPAVGSNGEPVTYTVSEEFATSKGYSTQYEVNTVSTAWNGGTGAQDAIEGESPTNEDDTVMAAAAQSMVTDKDNCIEFNNSRNSVTPTGIVMNVAPYALLVVIAAAGCFVFLRKRRED